jgi:ferredoxin-type protein NapF
VRQGRLAPPRLRRWSQLLFLLLFLALLTLTVWPLGRVFLGAFLVADPLIALSSLVNGVVRPEMLLALAVLLAPLLVGRAFCGWVCPMGTVVELLGPKRDRRSGPAFLRSLPPLILTACLGLLLFGVGAFLVFDPLVLLTRSATILLYPVLDRGARITGDVLYLLPWGHGLVDAVTGLLSGRIVFARPLFYQLQVLVVGMLGAMLALSFVQRRLWCRHLCPLGALLGQVGRRSLLGRVVDPERCTGCGRCKSACPLGAIEGDGALTDTTRCELGFECAGVCPQQAVGFGRRVAAPVVHDPSRRALVTTGALALGAGLFLWTGRASADALPFLVRPPGAREPESEFLARCSRCGQCLKVCPTNVLQPSLLGGTGLEGVFTPQLSFDRGFCDWSCNECCKVCPTGAIQPLTLAAKRRWVIGRASIDHGRCIPWAEFKDCLVCQELCPIPDKAVVFRPETVADPLGRPVTLKRPWVVVDRCIGCGICEANCPVSPEAAIRVRGLPRSQRG